MTNREIKLELVKATLMGNSECLDSLKELYNWIVEDDVVDVDTPKTDYDNVSIGELIKFVDREDLGHCGYGARLQNILFANNITTIGDLLRIGRRTFSRYRDIGRGSITRIDDALEELYGIKDWYKS